MAPVVGLGIGLVEFGIASIFYCSFTLFYYFFYLPVLIVSIKDGGLFFCKKNGISFVC